MRRDTVEIFSDVTNAAVIRHPARRFPGVLLQGDTLNGLCRHLDRALTSLEPDTEALDELAALRETLQDLRAHYEAVMTAHGLALPY